jgi:putative tricarboxylic transport membrane protein
MIVNFNVILDILDKLATVEFALTFVIGIVGGIIIGALPGFSSSMGVALLIPITFGMDPVAGLTMLATIYAASTYGGSFSAILIHTPGTSSSVATCMDGYPMTLKGEGLRALGISTVSSVIGEVVGALALLFLAPPLARISLKFSAPEYFLLAIFGLSIIAGVSSKAITKGLISGAFGLFLGVVGVDIVSGISRYTFGITSLEGGITMIPPMIGLFSLSEVLVQMERIARKEEYASVELKGRFLPSWKEFKTLMPTISISSIIGLIIGILPAAGADIAAWVSYDQARRRSKTPEKFGTGFPIGVAAPEAGNNAACGGSLIPLLTLGIPGSATAAILMGGLLMQGLHTGHELFTKHITTTYAIIIGYLLANILMGFIGWLSAKHIVKVSMISKPILVPIIVILSVVGTYSVTSNMFEVYFMIFFGVLGYFMRKANYSTAAVILGLILGPIVEAGITQSIVMAKGNVFMYFITRPISVILLVLMIVTFFIPAMLKRWNKKNNRIVDDTLGE